MRQEIRDERKTPIIACKNLSFCYPQERHPCIKDISFEVYESEFVVLCGQSGCGKTTLLRHLKKNQIPFGTGQGELFFRGQDLEKMSDRDSAEKIGFVGQNPDSQLVTDKVWHELAFGLENLGMDNQKIRRRIAETAAWFGMEEQFRKPVDELSGGQKQILNLAAVLVMKPEVLILDEPTSMLDPIGTRRFLDTLGQLNREFGMTIILSEQCLEEVIPMADRVLIMDQGILCDDVSPGACMDVLSRYRRKNKKPMPIYPAMPTAMRVWDMANESIDGKSGAEEETAVPISIRQGRLWLRRQFSGEAYPAGTEERIKAEAEETSGAGTEEVVLEASHVCFGYFRGQRILDDFNLQVRRGRIFAIMGGNGSGKTTALKVMMNIVKPQRGRVRHEGKMLCLSQNPMSLFSQITAEDELAECLMTPSGRYLPEICGAWDAARKVNEMMEFLQLDAVRKTNPLDLSGGEKQRLAMGKLLMGNPDILLLDEPTKGLDGAFKQKLAQLLVRLCGQGKTIVMVSHDMEFCGSYATDCGLLFDGCLTGASDVREFFSENTYYTTAAARMGRGITEGCISAGEIARAVREGVHEQ